MDLKKFIGMKAKTVDNDGRLKEEIKLGTIEEDTQKLIVVKYEKYKESFNIGSILSNDSVFVRSNKKWMSMRKLILEQMED